MAPTASHYEPTGPDGRLRILIEQIGQNQRNNTSSVRVRGMMFNDSDHEVHNTLGPVGRTITGYGPDYEPDKFNFSIGGNRYYAYIDRTYVVQHDGEGKREVSFAVHYGTTGTAMFQANKVSGDNLVLTRIPKRPAPPGQPQFSSVLPTSLHVSWSASPDANGSPILTYRLRRWTGGSQSGPYTDSIANSLSRNITGLTPGQNYTFAAYARNSAEDNDGWSNASADNHTQMQAGAWIRVNGGWVRAVAYVRDGGTWKMAVPYVRDGGSWRPTG